MRIPHGGLDVRMSEIESGQLLSAAQLRVLHVHHDGAYAFEQDKPRFLRVNAPAQSELEALLTRITRQLQRDGSLVADEPQPSSLNPSNAANSNDYAAMSHDHRWPWSGSRSPMKANCATP